MQKQHNPLNQTVMVDMHILSAVFTITSNVFMDTGTKM